MGNSIEADIQDQKIRELFVALDGIVGEELYVEQSVVVENSLYEMGLKLTRGRLESYSVVYGEYERFLTLGLSGDSYRFSLSRFSRVRLSITGPSFEDPFFVFEGVDSARKA